MLFDLFFKNFLFKIFLSIISGVFGVLSFSPYNIWPIAIISLVILFKLIYESNIKESCLISFFWGFGFYGTGISWIYISLIKFGGLSKILSIIIFIFFIIYLSLYIVLFGFLFKKYFFKKNILNCLFNIPGLWIVLDYFRSSFFTGFPWLQFGYSQINSPLNFIAPILGFEFITFLIVMISSFFYFFKNKLYLFLYFFLFFLFSFFLKNIYWYYPIKNDYIKVTLIQGNEKNLITYNIKDIKKKINVYYKYTKPVLGKSKIIIWPESIIPNNIINQKNLLYFLNKIMYLKNTILITGIISSKRNLKNFINFNSVIFLGKSLIIKSINNIIYKKYHLVPFGEYIPMKLILYPLLKLINFPMENFSKGNYLQSPQNICNKNFLTILCYEVIFSEQIKNNFSSQVDFLLTLSNNSWFGNSIEPWQHYQMACMRSLELGRSMLYCSNNGITAIINPDGSCQKKISQFISKSLTLNIIRYKGITPYSKFKIIPIKIFVIIFIIISIFLKKLYKIFN
ncbi:apolipoprotein N-acyltransferase [Sodalis-like secondary symbiont of Drepanosiphum platanoidis]|uniref:apolipoprotein N-acyltransferase n=1 Tax=Sodalis-like secondary symbiont of Drepanosiphum platanoidis TaxID=2994493 RepID=UPI00346442B8